MPRDGTNEKYVQVGLTPEQLTLLETAREIVRINGLPTNNKSVLLIALKSFVESQQEILKKQYDVGKIRSL